MNQRVYTAAVLVVTAGASLALGQGAPKQEPAQKEPAAKESAAKEPVQTPAAEEPSLDDLLGLPKATPAKPADPEEGGEGAVPTPEQAELERRLSLEQINDQFEQAVALMDQTTVRLASAKDPGIDTQRLQQDILLKLDALIDQAQKQQSQGGKSKKQQKSQQQNAQNQQQAQSSQQQQGQQQQQAQQANAQGGNVAQQQADPSQVAPGGGAAWGNLPTHVRDSLMQGLSDRFSGVYRAMTEEYYKRLAEEPKDGVTGR